MRYFVDNYENIVSNVKENSDFTEISENFALKLIDEQIDEKYWLYTNNTNLKRYDERMFNINDFLIDLERSVAVFTNSCGTCLRLDKKYIQDISGDIYKVLYKYEETTNYLFIETFEVNIH